MERKEVSDAILGVLNSGGELTSDERNYLLGKNTKDFGPDIIKNLKNLGVVKKTNDGMGSYGSIVKKISDGIKISELIKDIGDN
jgi:hypothetical protein